MKMQLLTPLVLVSAFTFAPQVHARPNDGAPGMNAGVSQGLTPGPKSFEQFQTEYQGRTSRVSSMRSSESKEANVISLITEMAAYVVPMTKDVVVDGSQSIASDVSKFTANYRKLSATLRALPAGSPKLAELETRLTQLTQRLQKIDFASSAMASSIDEVNSSIGTEQYTINSRYPTTKLVTPAQTAFTVLQELTSAFSDFDRYEKSCASQLSFLSEMLSIEGLSSATSSSMRTAESACVSAKPQVSPGAFEIMASQLHESISSLHANYRIINTPL